MRGWCPGPGRALGLGSFTNYVAWGASADASVVVGYAQPTNSSPSSADRAFVWTSGTGMTALTSYLAAQGVGPVGGTRQVYGISADGRRMTATAILLPLPSHNFMDRGAAGAVLPNCDGSSNPDLGL